MSKISKFLIFCITLIISLCSFVVPTYCSDISSTLFEIDFLDKLPNYNNYYNASNITYVNYKNFKIYNNSTNVLYGTNVSSLPSSFSGGKIFNDNYSTDFYGYTLNVESSYRLYVYDSHFILTLSSFNISGLDSVVLNMSPSENSAILGLHFVPFEFLNGLNGQFNSLHLYPYFSIQFDIDYNGQHFYNDTFCFVLKPTIVNGIVNTLNPTIPSSLRKEITFTDNFEDTYYKSLHYSDVDNFNGKYIYFKNYLYSDRYLAHIRCDYRSDALAFGDVTGLTRLYFQIDFKYVDYGQIDSINIFSGNSIGSGGAVGSLIPNGSNNFYKTAEWWDIPSHLYNFFIYLIFDAPIISNFTKLGMFIINFLVESFNFIISLFNGVSNVFFISIFVGMLSLIFLLKIIFGGKS